MISVTKNNSITSFYLFSDYDVQYLKWEPTPLHPDDVTILFLDYDVYIFDDVNAGVLWRHCVPVSPLQNSSFYTAFNCSMIQTMLNIRLS